MPRSTLGEHRRLLCPVLNQRHRSAAGVEAEREIEIGRAEDLIAAIAKAEQVSAATARVMLGCALAPKPYTLALERHHGTSPNAASDTADQTREGEPPKPYTLALARRRARADIDSRGTRR
jgi:hypothetical protein